MPALTWDTFERYKQRGLDARRAGQWDSARIYLLQAARAMVQLSKEAQSQQLRQAREDIAQRLLELARDCATAEAQKRRRPDAPAATAESSGSDADPSNHWLVREKPAVQFTDVAGLDEVKEEIRLKMLYPFEHPELAEKFGVRGGGGVLLFGPPGTGKTLLARATAGEIDAAFFRIAPSDILSKWVGEAEQNIRKLFDAARAEDKSIIFIDEIEALIPARRDEGSSVMQRLVPQILQEMEGFDKNTARSLLFMGATNVPWQLDPAVLRPGRFDEKIYIPLPDLPARQAMLDMYLKNRPLADAIDLDQLARQMAGYSGADIKHLCDRAAIIPFLRAVGGSSDAQITPEILQDAMSDIRPSVTPDMVKRFERWKGERSV